MNKVIPNVPTLHSSAEAGRSIDKKRLQDVVLTAIQAAGIYGRTCDELEGILGGRHQTVSPRVNELMKAKKIISGGRRMTRSGRKATIWVTPENATP